MYLKLLRSFAVIERLSIIVKIFLAMLGDVVWFMVMYVLFLIAFSFLMIGAGNPDSVADSCGDVSAKGSEVWPPRTTAREARLDRWYCSAEPRGLWYRGTQIAQGFHGPVTGSRTALQLTKRAEGR